MAARAEQHGGQRRDPLSGYTALLRYPSLWPTAVVQARRLVPPGWWRRRPFLPVPSRAYYRFRMETQYGDAGHRVEIDDVVTYLRWCRAWNRARNRARPHSE